jgi:hypothetical protein
MAPSPALIAEMIVDHNSMDQDEWKKAGFTIGDRGSPDIGFLLLLSNNAVPWFAAKRLVDLKITDEEQFAMCRGGDEAKMETHLETAFSRYYDLANPDALIASDQDAHRASLVAYIMAAYQTAQDRATIVTQEMATQ